MLSWLRTVLNTIAAVKIITNGRGNQPRLVNLTGIWFEVFLYPVDGKWLEIFLEKQIEHSREDVDHFKRILAGL